MKLETVGYYCAARHKESKSQFSMAYGEGKDPGPEQLLFERGLTLFETEKAATEALLKSLSDCESQGQDWMRWYTFSVLPVKRISK